MSVNDLLTAAMFAAALYRCHWLPFLIVLVYALHLAADPFLTATAYYFSACAVDVLCVGLTAWSVNREGVARWRTLLAYGCLASAVVNAVGWFLWYSYQPAIYYNAAVTVAYVFIICAILDRSPRRHGDINANTIGAGVLRSVSAGRAVGVLHRVPK